MNDRVLHPELLQDFISAYRAHPCLWQANSPDYSNRAKRQSAYQQLVELCSRVYPCADVAFVKSKIKNLRTVVRKEYRKVQQCARINEPYSPRLWYYDLLKFTVEQEAEEPPEDVEADVSSPEGKSGIALQLPSPVVKELPSASASKSRNVSNKRRRENEEANSFQLPVNNTCDEFDAFGITVAAKLRKLAEEQRLLAEILINQILYKGATNQLSEGTVVSDQFQGRSFESVLFQPIGRCTYDDTRDETNSNDQTDSRTPRDTSPSPTSIDSMIDVIDIKNSPESFVDS